MHIHGGWYDSGNTDVHATKDRRSKQTTEQTNKQTKVEMHAVLMPDKIG